MSINNILCIAALVAISFRGQSQENLAAPVAALQPGDTLYFGGGSLSGQFVHVYYRVGTLQKRKASFSAETVGLEWLLVDRLVTKKVLGKPQQHAVMKMPHRPRWEVWVEVAEALRSGEVKTNPYRP